MVSNFERIATEFEMTSAEAVVLMTVGYDIPLPRARFVPHAVWEGGDEFTDPQVAQAYASCLAKGWIQENFYERPEFTELGRKLWDDVGHALTRWGE